MGVGTFVVCTYLLPWPLVPESVFGFTSIIPLYTYTYFQHGHWYPKSVFGLASVKTYFIFCLSHLQIASSIFRLLLFMSFSYSRYLLDDLSWFGSSSGSLSSRFFLPEEDLGLLLPKKAYNSYRYTLNVLFTLNKFCTLDISGKKLSWISLSARPGTVRHDATVAL